MKPIKELLNFSLINIDKPAGPTSFSVSEFVCRRLGLSKTSHMGTLDPKVTGVLPITLGRACKLASYFIRHDKCYVGILHTHKEMKISDLQKLVDENFIGKIKQTPPNRSAVKREEREREIYSFQFLESSESKRDFLFSCSVEGGTYIRKICSDLGEKIGGAHMGELRRTEAGIFSEDSLVSLYEFETAVSKFESGNEDELRAMLVPAEVAVKRVMKSVYVDKRALKALHTGKPLFSKDIIVVDDVVLKDGEVFALFTEEDVFVGVYRKIGGGKMDKEKVTTGGNEIFGRSEFVFN